MTQYIHNWALQALAVIALVALVGQFTGWFDRWFCKHDWAVIQKTYSKPPMTGVSLSYPEFYWYSDAPVMMKEKRLAFERDTRDVTCLLLQCKKCKKVLHEEMWGAPVEARGEQT
jgi:hypothetical protein